MPDPERLQLLYVEDEIFTQHLVETSLREAGYDVWTASNGAKALERLASVGPAVRGLVTDVNLGDGPDGWEVSRQARAFSPNLPVIYVSGASTHEWGTKGVSDSMIVAKPFSPDQIVSAMALLLGKARR